MGKEEKYFEIRMDFIKKVHSMDEKFIWGIMIFFGSIILILINTSNFTNYQSLLSLVLIIFYFSIILFFIETIIIKHLNKMHAKLIKDLKNNELENIENYSLKYIFKSSLGFK